MKNQTIVALFESNKLELENKLKNLSLPQDAQKVQEIVSGYLNELLDGEGDFRQNLTQSEDYILQAACSLLNSQQRIIEEMAKHSMMQSGTKNMPDSNEAENKKEQFAYPLAGSAAGGAIGGILLGTWGAAVGAIIGTAIALYVLSQYASAKKTSTKIANAEVEPQEKSINTDIFLTIIQQICRSIDNLIDTFRTQMNRIENAYQQNEKPTLWKDYTSLVKTIQNLSDASNDETKSDEDKSKMIQMRIKLLLEALENYGIVVINGKLTEQSK